ncbi:MAG: diguanylate cyclase, partial [Actinomycetota bacterium]
SLMTADAVMLQAWQSRKTLLVSKFDAEANPTLANLLPEGNNVVVVPLTAEGGSVGIVVLEQGTALGSRIERRVVSMVERFCSHAALALRNASLVDQLRDMAATDGLTGVANRRTFEAALEVELDRAARSGSALSLVMVDLDEFKKLNDTHGHQAGDDVLKRVAEALKKQSRGFDTPARYGGEEFAVIMPGCDLADAERSAERFRAAIAQVDAAARVTASAGVATFPSHATDAKTLVQMADAALYESKGAGRNRTTLAHPLLADAADQLLAEPESTTDRQVGGDTAGDPPSERPQTRFGDAGPVWPALPPDPGAPEPGAPEPGAPGPGEPEGTVDLSEETGPQATKETPGQEGMWK